MLVRDLQQLTELRDYYREKRLKYQAAFFKTQSEADVSRDQWWRSIPHRLFKASVIIVTFHVVVEAVVHTIRAVNARTLNASSLSSISIFLDVLIAFAALLPVIGSGIRTWRSASEMTRNISRFRAKYVALSNIEQRMQGREIKENVEAEALIRDLWCAEQIMESEHREWLRLMIGAEWVG